MDRRLRFRLTAAFLAAVYLALPAGASGVRECAHHDAAPVEPATDDAHSGHGATSSSDEHDTGDTHDGCSCLDTCAAGTSLVLAAQTAPASFDQGWMQHAVDQPADRSPHPRPPHFLPFPHGPPTVPA